MPAEETLEPVDFDGANAFFNGQPEEEEEQDGEEEEEEEQDEGDGLVEVRVKGQAIRLTPENASAIQRLIDEGRERDGRLGGELAKMREALARQEGALSTMQAGKTPKDEMPEPPSPTLARDDFEQYHREMIAYQSKMMLKQQEDLRGAYEEAERQRTIRETEAQQLQAWGNGFYAEYPRLDRPELKGIVRDAYVANGTEIDALPLTEQYARLAELAEERIVAVNSALKTNTDRPPRVEGAGRSRPTGQKTKPDVKPMSGEEWMRRKRAQMRGEKVD